LGAQVRLREKLLRVWLDRGGEHVDERARQSERNLQEIKQRTRRLEQMLDVKLQDGQNLRRDGRR
jgi:predicted transcriptional regulator